MLDSPFMSRAEASSGYPTRTPEAVRELPMVSIRRTRDEEDLWDGIYAGEIYRFWSCRPIGQLLRIARAVTRDAFETQKPITAHRKFHRDEMLSRCSVAQAKFREDPDTWRLAVESLAAVGIDPSGIHLDTVELRIAPPVATHGGGVRSHVGVHRDVWGVAIPQQVNWWSTAWPLTRKRTMAFYPAHWHRPIANDTATWSVKDYLAAKREAPAGVAPSYPSAPRALEEPVGPALPVLIPHGDLLCFSSAHLHGSIPNETMYTRISVEWRSVRESDVRDGRGAHNVDCATPRPIHRIFSSALGKRRLDEALAGEAAPA